MYPDEVRDPERVSELVVREATSNPDELYKKYMGLVVRYRKLENESRKQIKAGSIFSAAERQDLKRRIRSAHEALEQARKDLEKVQKQNRQLALKIEALRNSRTMKAGKIIAFPVTKSRVGLRSSIRLAQIIRESPREAFLKLFTVAQNRLKTATNRIGTFDRKTTQPKPQNGVSPKTLDKDSLGSQSQPNENFDFAKNDRLEEQKNSQASFESKMNELWFKHGQIRSVIEMAAQQKEELERLSSRGKITYARIKGLSNLLDKKPHIGEPNNSPVYTPEENRVMYCVHQTPCFNSNGYSTRTRGIVSGLKSAGVDVVVVARSGYPWDSATDGSKPKSSRTEVLLDGVSYVHVPGGELTRDPLDIYIQRCADAFVREAKYLRPTIIQAASNHITALPALIAARRLGVPFVYEVRGFWEISEAAGRDGYKESDRFNYQKDLETLVATSADKILAITRQVADELVNRGVDRERIEVAPNAVNTTRFMPLPSDDDYRKQRGLKTGIPTIGFAGSLVDYEGLDTLLEASRILNEEGLSHQIVIAGSGKAEAGLKGRSKELGLSNVKFMGRLSQDEIPVLLNNLDIVVCPRKSLEVTELVSPLKPLESFSTATPTILSNVAPHLDLAGDNEKRAKLFEAGNSQSLAKEIRNLVNDPDEARKISRAARLWTVQERNWPMIGLQLSKAYDKLRLTETDEQSRRIEDLRVAVIADEFTTETLSHSFTISAVSRANWRQQFEEGAYDFLFVESAWEGNGGEWTRGVGFYSEEESKDLFNLLDFCKEAGIPTVFWNKEDPVHFRRFAPTAKRFDHVFTTDANVIGSYLRLNGASIQTVSSMPFFAEPKIHNPLNRDEDLIEHSVMYAGTYYGNRYPDRSKALDKLLRASKNLGVTIYDRQASDPNSSYKFPAEFQKSVMGALPYREIVRKYGSYVASLNVNSVVDSPTMFSRRVVEIPACGGLVLSSYGRGIEETLGSNIPATDNEAFMKAWIHAWSTDPNVRLEEVWRQYRTIHRSHTSRTSLSILVRTIGLNVTKSDLPRYVVRCDDSIDPDTVAEIKRQSIRPGAVIAPRCSESAEAELNALGIEYFGDESSLPSAVSFVEADFMPGLPRTYYEDLLYSYRFGDWARIYVVDPSESAGLPFIANASEENGSMLAMRKIGSVSVESGKSLTLRMNVGQWSESNPSQVSADLTKLEGGDNAESLEGKTVLIAGHDLKFAGPLISALEVAGAVVLIDNWKGHNKHDESMSRKLLKEADYVFCEWGLGNAVWYSNKLAPHQKLVVRIHLQEITLPYLRRIKKQNVSKFIFVGEMIRQAAIRYHGVPDSKSIVIGNIVDSKALDRPKAKDANKTIGFVGIVPQRKRLDLALDVLEHVLKVDPEYTLRIKGRRPEEYSWMLSRKDELAYYNRQYKRIAEINRNWPGSVVFDGFGSDMADWYRGVGIVISVSDFESFHLTIADGAASGARAYSLNWDGADLIYPDSWLASTTEELAQKILQENSSSSWKDFVHSNFRKELIVAEMIKTFS